MKFLFIGGTGNISTFVSRLVVARGHDLYLLNRGQRPVTIDGAHTLTSDITDLDHVRNLVAGHHFDAVVNWIAFTPPDVERDYTLFKDITGQYVFISSASVYQTPPSHPVITESTPLHNPVWQYSRNKIACEEWLNHAYQREGFPATIVRPSHTYGNMIPATIGSGAGYTNAARMLKGKPVIVPGDGSSLWTLTHADDFAVGFAGLLGNPQAIGHAFHITSDEILTWNQICTILADALGVEPNLVHIPSDVVARLNPEFGAGLLGDKSWSVIFDNTKIKTFVPEFRATIPFYEGVRRVLAWYDEDEGRKRIDTALDSELDRIVAAYQQGLAGL